MDSIFGYIKFAHVIHLCRAQLLYTMQYL